jgi:hypothetical protein
VLTVQYVLYCAVQSCTYRKYSTVQYVLHSIVCCTAVLCSTVLYLLYCSSKTVNLSTVLMQYSTELCSAELTMP